jgi:hypothetical protein
LNKITYETKILISLIFLLAASNVFAEPYKRSLYPHWSDLDSDCQNSRMETLITESLNPVTFKTDNQCKVLSGWWYGVYSGEFFSIAKHLDIDHIVPLKEAHLSGADIWTTGQRKAFANDPDNLLAVKASENRSKGAKDPAHWLPSDENYHCIYIAKWLAVKLKYDLDIDDAEQQVINEVVAKSCDKL